MGILEKVREEFLKGKPIILVDEEREIEGDFVYPAQMITPEIVEFITKYGKGLFCVVAPQDELLSRGFFKLPSNFGANYFIPVDYQSTQLSTGIPAKERAITCQKIANNSCKINDFKYPGHVTVIGAVEFSKRKGHSESSIELLRMTGFEPYSVIIEILDDEGDSHNFNYIEKLSKKFNLLKISIKEVWKEYVKKSQLLKIKAKANLPTKYGLFKIVSFDNSLDFKEHFALVKEYNGTPFVRIHSECVTGDCLSSLRCDCGSQLDNALKFIEKEGGVILYLRQEGRNIGLSWKVNAYELQDSGLDTYEANLQLGFKPDERDYAIAAQMLKAMGIDKIKLLTNNPDKVRQLREYGIEIEEQIPIIGQITKHNVNYLKTKVKKFGHSIQNVEG